MIGNNGGKLGAGVTVTWKWHWRSASEDDATVVPADAQPVPEATWRKYWDTQYEVN